MCLRYGNVRSSGSSTTRAESGILRAEDAHNLRGAQTQASRPRQEREGGSVDCEASFHRRHVRSVIVYTQCEQGTRTRTGVCHLLIGSEVGLL